MCYQNTGKSIEIVFQLLLIGRPKLWKSSQDESTTFVEKNQQEFIQNLANESISTVDSRSEFQTANTKG